MRKLSVFNNVSLDGSQHRRDIALAASRNEVVSPWS